MDESEAAKFLERDFNQCFAQMRHYDSQFWNVYRFSFTAYVAILGTVVAMYQYSIEKNIDLIPAAMVVLGVGLVLGLQIYVLTVRNRVYYVVVCRYINEHRKLFLKAAPLGFENISGMYVNPRLPPYFDWLSWQSWLCYIIASLNALLAGLLIYYALDEAFLRYALAVTLGMITIVLQIGLGIKYLKSREDKGGSKGVFGRK